MSKKTPLTWLPPVPAPRNWAGTTYKNAPSDRPILSSKELPFDEIVFVDTEYNGCIGNAPAEGHPGKHGNPINPICLVARELYSCRETRLWHDQIGAEPPYPIDATTLFVCFSATAENGFHLACRWKRPACILDLHAEFKNIWNGLSILAKDQRRTQLNALVQYGIIDHQNLAGEKASKDRSRDLILAGDLERLGHKHATLDYCAGDVDDLMKLFFAMLPEIFPDKDYIDEYLHYALMRGRAAANFAVPERIGIPLDVALIRRFDRHKHTILDALIQETDKDYGIYKGSEINEILFSKFVAKHDLVWPRTEKGYLSTEYDTLKDMSVKNPELIGPLRDLAEIIPLFKRNCIIAGYGKVEIGHDGKEKTGLIIGRDGRNRTGLLPFGTVTGRCTPSTAEYIFQWSKALHSFIMPKPGMAILCFDWKAQEVFLAGGLSGDKVRMLDYQTGDVYTAFGKRIGMIPADWPKKPKHKYRGQCKICELSIQYLRTDVGLARVLLTGIAYAREMLKLHRKTYWKYWTWSDAVRNFSKMYGYIYTIYGWVLHLTPDTKVRTICNFPMQSHGAHMLHLALGYLVDAGIQVCGTVHDSICVECEIGRIEETTKIVVDAMERASSDIVPGHICQVDVLKPVIYLDRLVDEVDVIDQDGDWQDRNNRKLWKVVMDALERGEANVMAAE